MVANDPSWVPLVLPVAHESLLTDSVEYKGDSVSESSSVLLGGLLRFVKIDDG